MASFEYGQCSRCGATTITLYHWITGSNIEINPLPHSDGNVLPDFSTGKCRVVLLKHMKLHTADQLWQPHVATCAALQKEVV
jgi:hypothetical protein